MPTLPEKLVTEFENLQQNHPYRTYGAGIKHRAEELIRQSKEFHRQPGQEWNLNTSFSDDELRLILSDASFAKKMLKAYDPSFQRRDPTPAEILEFRSHVSQQKGDHLFPHVRVGQNYPKLPQRKVNLIRENAEKEIADHQKLQQQADRMLSQTSRLAPLSTLHTTAKDMLQRNNPSESLRLGRQEIAAAGRTDIPREIAPYLRQASETPAAFLRQYELDYAPIINNYRQEAARDFLEHDLPTINNQFASRGAFYSGAREAALNKARVNKEERIERRIAELMMHAREEGMKNYHQYRQGHLRQAEISGHAHQAQQDSRLRAAEALRVNQGTEQAALHQQAMALSQMGRTEQQQAQNELNVRQQEHREEMERPFLQHMRKAAIASRAPFPHGHLSPESINPPPPNAYGFGAGLMGQTLGLMGQQQQSQQHGGFAQGGHVRHKYSEGDSVNRAAAQLLNMRNHIQETPEEAEMRQSAQHFKNYRANPMADYLFATGSHMLGNLSGSPMKAYGEGSQLGMQAFKAAQGTQLSAQEKYHNLMNKINQSKMYQHEFLSKHHALMQQQEETMRHHQAQEAESRHGHDITRDLAMEKLKLMGNLRSGVGSNVKMSPTEKKLVNDAKKDLKRALTMRKELEHLSGLLNKTSSGPVIGGIKSVLPKTNVDNQIEVATNKLIMDMHQGMKNIPRSEEFLKRLETTKPSRHNYPEANKLALNMMSQGSSDVFENSISTLLEAGWSPEKIEREFKIKVPEHLLEEGNRESEESLAENDQHEDSVHIIEMMDPHGRPLSVPEDQVEEALSLGATIAH